MSDIFVPLEVPPGYKKRQHQIFRGYFNAYSKFKGHAGLVYLNKRYVSSSARKSAKGITRRDHFYETSHLPANTLEDFFGDLEDKWGPSLREVKASGVVSDENFTQLMQLAYSLGGKTEDSIDRIARIFSLAKLDHGGKGYREASLGTMIQLILDAINWSIRESPWHCKVINSLDSNRFYLTSDRPIIFGDFAGLPMRTSMALHYGPNSIVFPISSDKLFVAYLKEFPDLIVKNHNRIQTWLAKDYIVADAEKEVSARAYLSSFIMPWAETAKLSEYLGESVDELYYVTDPVTGELTTLKIIRVLGLETEYYQNSNGDLLPIL